MKSDPNHELLRPAENILRGRKYHVVHWVVEGYAALVAGRGVISDADALKIGTLEAFKLMCIKTVTAEPSRKAIRTKFASELKEIEDNAKEYCMTETQDNEEELMDLSESEMDMRGMPIKRRKIYHPRSQPRYV